MENEQQPTQTNYHVPQQRKGISVGVALILGISGIIIAAIIGGAIIFASGAKTVRDIDFEKFDGFDIKVDENGEQTNIIIEKSEKEPAVLSEAEAAALVSRVWGIDFTPTEGRPPQISLESQGSNTYLIEVTIPQLDDSVFSVKKEGIATHENGSWSLSAATDLGFACAPGRGHQDFSFEPCM